MRHMLRLIRTLSLGLAIALIGAAATWAASPSLGVILPRGLQRGATSVLTFHGGNLADAKEILFFSPGFEVTKLEPSAGAVKATIKVAKDCRLGEHVAHVRTATGLTEYRTFYVGPFPEIKEKEPNSDFKSPQPIPMNVTVNGVIDTEDVDYFVVEAKKGQRISVEIEGMRLGVTMFDPYIAILDSKRFELITADDSPLLKQDALASIVAPADGKYIIQVRESSYGGDGNCHYRLHVGNFPRPIAVYPAGGKLGEETEVRFLGDPTGDIVRKVKLPSKAVPDFGLVPEDATGTAPSEIPFRLSQVGNVLEKEPNDSMKEATPAELPKALNGILQKPGDVDFFRFKAKKGETYEVECFGRRIRSAIDAVMYLYNSAGQALLANDDSRGPDPYFRFTAPADGEYFLSVTDHLKRGGPGFVYRVEFLPVEPKVTTGLPQVARYSQFRQQIYVARGNRFGAVISAGRENFGGELLLDPQNMPAGIKMIADPMPANASTMPVVFEAAKDAPLSGKLVDLRAKHIDPKQKISGGFFNHAEFVIAAPGQSLFSWCDVDRVAVAVLEELPYTLEIVEPKVPLVQSGLMYLKIRAHRKPGFTEPINVQVPFLPPGVGGNPSVDIPKGQNEVLFQLNANGGAEIKKWKIFALGSANVNGGAAWASSQMANLEIAPPYLQFNIQRAAVEQGQKTDLVCGVTVAHPFDGAAKVQVLGFPPKVIAPEMELKKDMKELVFKVSTDKGSPAGTHKNIFCQATIMEHGEPIVHYVGGTELRIDQPLPAPAKPAPAAVVAKKDPPKTAAAPKRLTRLEQLRLDAKEKAQAAAAK
ncbi:MAG TPA: PPC domain-containing protein [Planctomycetaceae bacterium]|nr:PPC domain-containing protein [Planctomycetaceae bacterium]